MANLPPYPAYKTSGVEWLGDVPAHWEVRRLRDSVLDCVGGVWGSEPNGIDDLPCVRVADFDRQRLRVRMDTPTIRAIAPSERRQRILAPGDLLLEKSGGGDLQPVGAVMLYDHGMPAVCSNFVALLRVRTGFDSGFLTFLHSTLYALRLNVRSIKQTTGIQNLDTSAYLSERVCIPPLAEQRAIARYLDHADRRIQRYIEAKEKSITLLQEARQAIIQRAVTRGFDPSVPLKASGVDWLGDVPAHWSVKKASWLFSIGSGTTPPTERTEYYGGRIPWITTSELRETVVTSTEKTVTEEALRTFPALNVFPRGSIAVAMYGATIGRLGILGVPATVNQACCVFSEPKGMHLHFWFYWLQSRRHHLISLGLGGGQPNLSQNLLKSIRVPTPPLDEQKEIVAHLDRVTASIDAAVDTARRQCELMREYKVSLITASVTGEVDVRAAAADPRKGGHHAGRWVGRKSLPIMKGGRKACTLTEPCSHRHANAPEFCTLHRFSVKASDRLRSSRPAPSRTHSRLPVFRRGVFNRYDLKDSSSKF